LQVISTAHPCFTLNHPIDFQLDTKSYGDQIRKQATHPNTKEKLALIKIFINNIGQKHTRFRILFQE